MTAMLTLAALQSRAAQCEQVLKSEPAQIAAKPGEQYQVARSPRGFPIAYEVSRSGDPNAPLLVFVNGQMYGLHGFREFSAALKPYGVDTVSIAFSLQPESISKMTALEKEKLLDATHSPETMADEVLAAIHAVKGKDQKVVLSALSFGSAVVPALLRKQPKLFSETILFAPLVEPGELYPKETAQMKQMENLWSLNPFFGSFAINQSRQYVTEQYIAKVFKEHPMATHYDVPMEPAFVEKAIVKLTRAAEDFNLVKQLATLSQPIHYLVAGEDDPNRLKNQVESFVQHRQRTGQGLLAVIPLAEHAKVFNFAIAPTALHVAALATGRMPSTIPFMFLRLENQQFEMMKGKTSAEFLAATKELNRIYNEVPEKANQEQEKKKK